MKYSQFIFALMLSTALGLANAYAGGKCGETDADCHWEIENGVLTISGSGAMVDYSSQSMYPWYSQKDSYTSVVVEGANETTGTTGITSIGDWAFTTMSGVTSLTLPENLTSIGTGAFSHMSGVTGGIRIPDGVTSIGSSAFYNMSGVTSLTLPKNLTSIGDYAFQGMTSVTGSISIPDGVTSIGNNAFYNMSGVTSLTLPKNLTSIGTQAFQNMSGVTSLTLPENLTSIGYGAFAGTNITTLDLPDSLVNIDRNAFSGMNSLQSLTISENFQGNLTNLVDGGAYQKALSSLAGAQKMLEKAQERGYSEDKIARYQELLEQAQSKVDAAKANLLANTDLFKINCRGDVELCKANLLAGLSEEYKIVLGTKFPFDVAQATYAEPDGHGGYTIKTYGGKIVGYKNKRIYTVEEANRVAGQKNRVSIKYR